MTRTRQTVLFGLTTLAVIGSVACSKKDRNFERILGGDAAGSAGASGNAGSAGQAPTQAGAAGDDGGASAGRGGATGGTLGEGGTAGEAAAGSPSSGGGGDASSTGGAGTSGAPSAGGTGTGGAATGGTSEAGGAAGNGGQSSGGAGTGGTTASGGTTSTGGAAGAAGAAGAPCVSSNTSEVICNDSIDDDCDGLLDCDDVLDCSAAQNCCEPSGSVELLCDDGKDDDCDGARDCDDTDCAANVTCTPECTPSAGMETDCANGIDDDCDGLEDCEDSHDCGQFVECQPACVPSGETEADCDDGLDNDCDGFLNCADSDCAASAVCLPTCTPVAEDCTNQVDDDCDGFVDCLDSVCAPQAVCCTGDSGETEICDDGEDNNCDGIIDCPVIVGAFPAIPPAARANWEGGVAAGTDVLIQLDAPIRQEYVVQCRTGKPSTVAGENFHVCNSAEPGALDVRPIEALYASDGSHNGVSVTQIRLAYPNGSVSRIVEYETYIHNSLVGADLCPPRAMPAAYFDAARSYLVSAAGDKFANNEARLRSPFVNVDFDPPLYTYFDVAAGSGAKEMLSLRRRFVLDPNNDMILMTRVYASRRAEQRRCLAATIRKHDTDPGLDANKNEARDFDNGCDAVVLNKDGAGVCLVVGADDVVRVAYTPSTAWQDMSEYWSVDANGVSIAWPRADIFMWRKLVPVGRTSTELRLFSPKCYMGGPSCVGSDPDILYLPDRDLFDL